MELKSEEIVSLAKAIEAIFSEKQKTLIIVSMMQAIYGNDYGKIIAKLEEFEQLFTNKNV